MSGVGLIIKSEGLDEALAATDQVLGVISGDAIRQAMGASMRLTLIEHFTKLEQDSVHHRSATALGADRTGFYADAAQSVQNPQIEQGGVSVSINKEGLAQRYFGGTIGARGSSWLTIPAIAQAYGRRARTFNNLHFVFFRPDLAALVENISTLVTRTRKGIYKPVASTIGAVFYWLKREVTQAADPSVLPTDAELLDPAMEAGEKEILRVWERPIGAATG